MGSRSSIDRTGGSGLPAGGSAGQLLVKNSSTDGDAGWATPAPLSGCRAYRSAAGPSATTATHFAIALDAEEFDTDAYHDNVTNPSRFVIPATGFYEASGQARFTAQGTGTRQSSIWKNGTGTGQRVGQTGPIINSGAAVTFRVPVATGLIQLVAGDFLELAVWQDSGGGLVVVEGIGETWFSIKRVA